MRPDEREIVSWVFGSLSNSVSMTIWMMTHSPLVDERMLLSIEQVIGRMISSLQIARINKGLPKLDKIRDYYEIITSGDLKQGESLDAYFDRAIEIMESIRV